jgi:hypothetical protein
MVKVVSQASTRQKDAKHSEHPAQQIITYQLLADSSSVRDLTLDGLHSTQQALLLLPPLLLLLPLATVNTSSVSRLTSPLSTSISRSLNERLMCCWSCVIKRTVKHELQLRILLAYQSLTRLAGEQRARHT